MIGRGGAVDVDWRADEASAVHLMAFADIILGRVLEMIPAGDGNGAGKWRLNIDHARLLLGFNSEGG